MPRCLRRLVAAVVMLLPLTCHGLRAPRPGFSVDFYDDGVLWDRDATAAHDVGVHWMAPMFSGGGYCSEAIAFVIGLADRGVRVTIEQHGDTFSSAFAMGLPPIVRNKLQRAWNLPVLADQSVVICHSEPGAWHPPRYPTSRCPPIGSMYTVGRTMFETDRLPAGWEDKLNAMHEVWVPTAFHARIFEEHGVDSDKLVVVPEPVDTDVFNPQTTAPLPGPVAYSMPVATPTFKFLSVFKWEYRKGWDVLLRAFAKEFAAEPSVELYVLTSSYHSSDDFHAAIDDFLQSALAPDPPPPASLRSRIVLVDTVPQHHLPAVYKAADAFVLPSRGEGWGRPHVEAMSMGLPIIATNWSGPTAFMTPNNSYPLRVASMQPIPHGAFAGHRMAQPCPVHLQALMRHVVDNREEAAARGAAARLDMVTRYHPRRVAAFVDHQVARIRDQLRGEPPGVPPPRPRRQSHEEL